MMDFSRKIQPEMKNPEMMDFSLISNEILKGIHIKENPSKNERNPGMKEFSLISK